MEVETEPNVYEQYAEYVKQVSVKQAILINSSFRVSNLLICQPIEAMLQI